MLQHSLAELAVCREDLGAKGAISPPLLSIFPLPTARGRKGGRKEGKARKKREGTTLLLHVLVLVMSACALGHLLVMSGCALGHLLSYLARAAQVVLMLGRACLSCTTGYKGGRGVPPRGGGSLWGGGHSLRWTGPTFPLQPPP